MVDLLGLTQGRDFQSLFAVDTENQTVKRINMVNSEANTVYKCEKGQYPYDLILLKSKEQNPDAERLALLSLSFCPHKVIVSILEECKSGMFAVIQSTSFLAKLTGLIRLVEMQNGTIVISGNDLSSLHIWTPGQQNTFDIPIPDGKSGACGMSIVCDPAGQEELVALTFMGDNSVDVFRMFVNALDLVQHISLPFKPSRLLWLASRKILLISPNDAKDEMHAVRISESKKVQKISVCGEQSNISYWCAWKEQNGIESSIVFYDRKMKVLKKLSIE